MTPEKAFQLYFAIRLHFTSKFDVFEMGTNFKGKNDVRDRKDFGLIYPITKVAETERDMIEYCVANHLYGNPEFLYDDEWAVENYKHWQTVKQSLTYSLEKDIGTIETYLWNQKCSLQDYLRNQVISDLLSHRVEYESLMLIDRRYPIIDSMQGFDALKYKVRMHKASKFVNKGTLDHRHQSHIDSFIATLERQNHGNNLVTAA